MARSPNEKAAEAQKLYKKGIKLVEIADRLGVPAGTVRRWKSTYCWEGEQKSERSDKKANVRKEKKGKEAPIAEAEVRQLMENEGLTDKQRLFCIHYIRCFNATKAYQRAYECEYATAAVNGSRLLENAKIKDTILRLKQDRLNRELLSETDIFQKYIDIAFADVNDFVDVHSGFVTAKAGIDGTIVSEVSSTPNGVKIKLADRMRALQWLTDHMDLATEKQKAEITLLKSRADANKDDRENMLDKVFEQLESALKDVE